MITGWQALLFGIGTFFIPYLLEAQSVAINTTGAGADSSAILDLASTQKGLLVPRLTLQERNALYQPAKALLIFNTTQSRFEVNTGTKLQPVWEAILTLEALPAQNQLWKDGGNHIAGEQGIAGTINPKSLGLVTNNTLRLYIDSTSGRIGLNTSHPKASLHIAATDALVLPAGNTAQRPATPVVGMIRFNTETGKLEGYTETGWKSLQ